MSTSISIKISHSDEELHKFTVSIKWDSCKIWTTPASFPGPAQLFVACNTEKRERAWYLYIRQQRSLSQSFLLLATDENDMTNSSNISNATGIPITSSAPWVPSVNTIEAEAIYAHQCMARYHPRPRSIKPFYHPFYPDVYAKFECFNEHCVLNMCPIWYYEIQ